eukprot:s7512_g1.t1
MAGAEANTPSDPWAAWGDPQQGAAPPTEAAPLPDPPQEQGDQTVGDVPEHGADSAEWPGDDWNGGTSTNWWSTDEQWTSDRWRWDRWQIRDDSYGRWEWRHDCGTESTRDSDHGSNGGRWQDRRGRAWVESEELCVDDLALESGVQTFKQWIIDRYQEVEISKVAKAWAYLNALGLSYAEELGVLASVGNEYNTHRLQKA